MGHPMLGMLAGANIQLVYLGWINAGGVMPSNTMVAGIYGTALTILSGANPKLAVTFAIPFSLLGLLMVQIYQTINSFWVHRADQELDKGNVGAIRWLNYVPSFIVSFVVYGIPAFCLVLFGKTWATALINAIPKDLTTALEVVGGLMPALGIAMLLNYLGKRSLNAFFIIGFFLAVYLKLDIMAIAIFSAAIAFLIFVSQTSGKKNAHQTAKKQVRRLSLNNRTGQTEAVATDVATASAEPETISADDYKRKLTHRDLVKTWLWEQSDEAAYNYERLQALGLTNMMIHPIRKLYDDPKRQAEELKKYMVFFNTEPHMVGPIIHGVALSMEEARANGQAVSEDDINGVRTGLMGPAAGIGDTVQQGILFPILASVGASMALAGNYLGPILFTVVFELIIYSLGYFLFMFGYRQGKSSVIQILKNGVIDKVTNAFSIVGLMVVGAMAATRVTVKTPLVWEVGKSTMKLQAILNTLAPGLIPLGITVLIWWLVAKKVNPTWIIIGIFVVGIALSYLNVLGIVK